MLRTRVRIERRTSHVPVWVPPLAIVSLVCEFNNVEVIRVFSFCSLNVYGVIEIGLITRPLTDLHLTLHAHLLQDSRNVKSTVRIALAIIRVN